ncbi:hypothetical protein PEDI_25790 [Persicobacter diffluens]|uniref:Uncharacterized protein n=1 Tax=Persicobacter diffluens TaxID=981 RepID=A0AAN4W0F2_9BACT|nr:hypothetical protein PEDI_25790 [Persicobacter diffluens]
MPEITLKRSTLLSPNPWAHSNFPFITLLAVHFNKTIDIPFFSHDNDFI